MSAFYVGQRVRIKWSDNWPEISGSEGVITGTGLSVSLLHNWAGLGFYVSPDAWGSNRAPRRGNYLATHLCARAEQLEPILPPGLESLEEINALYEPSPVEVRA